MTVRPAAPAPWLAALLHPVRSYRRWQYVERDRRAARKALALASAALAAHERWCGHNPGAPGDPVYNAAVAEAREVLYGNASSHSQPKENT